MKDFKLNFSSLGFLISELTKLLQQSNKTYRVSIKEWRERRSLDQNALFHVWADRLSEYLISKGNVNDSPEYCKILLKHKFLGYEYIDIKDIDTGEIMTISQLRHTSKLDVGEMTYFMNQCYAWCVDLGLLLPIPETSEYYNLIN